MSDKTIYISYRPEQSLHIAQPLFNGLRAHGYDVFMDIEEGIDTVNLHQIPAREHFIVILTPAALDDVSKPEDRLTEELRVAIDCGRNIVLLVTKDFDFSGEIERVRGLMTRLSDYPVLKIQPKQLDGVIRLLEEQYLEGKAPGNTIPTPPDEVDIVKHKIEAAREFTLQATIRLNTEKMFFRAVVKIRQGEYQAALNDLDLVIADNPNNESAYLQRARVLRKMGRKTAALKDYEQATHLSPKLVAAHIGHGELLLETGRYQQALKAFATALELQSESAPAIAGMALTRHAMDEPEEAMRLWGWLIERDSNYADPHWAGEVFDWDTTIIGIAEQLLSRL